MSRMLLSGVTAGAFVRRARRVDGKIFAVGTIRDSDRGEPRYWTVFANDPAVIEKLEKLKGGEPVALSGPFSVTVEGARLVYRLTADSIVTARKGRTKRKDNPLLAVDPAEAPKDDDASEVINDDLPF